MQNLVLHIYIYMYVNLCALRNAALAGGMNQRISDMLCVLRRAVLCFCSTINLLHT